MDIELLEEMRSLHERRDRLEMAIADEIMVKRTRHKDKLNSQHRQKRLLDKYMACSNELLQLYSKETNRPEPDENPQKACNDFFQHYNKILQTPDAKFETDAEEQNAYYSEEDGATLKDNLLDLTSVAVVMPNEKSDKSGKQSTLPWDTQQLQPVAKTVEKLVEFTDEEGYGRYLDLIECHESFLQVVKNQEVKPNYLSFLTKFDKFIREMERERKTTSVYKNYVEKMLNYFRDYTRRAKPLFDLDEMESRTEEKFLEQWNTRSLVGWFSEVSRTSNGQQDLPAEPMVDLLTYHSVEQLMELGLDCLKRELQVRELKCGGTLEDRAKRLWSIRGKQFDEIDNSLKVNAQSGGGAKKKKVSYIEPKYIASIEAKLLAYAEYFNEHIQATIENVQRKQARTADERNKSDDDDSDLDDDDDDDDDDDEESDHNDSVAYNPKNLPLGWDGKPIPYWLYKLHGLNQTFTCEICGNATYKGPKTFQRHFAEQKHALGMKCLGIPNMPHFANITSIQDAITLWEKLRQEKQKESFEPQIEEEYEDSQGNVVNKKTYEDLKRQGLL